MDFINANFNFFAGELVRGAAIESVEESEVLINRIPSKIFHDGD
jgi:hypothetical protein